MTLVVVRTLTGTDAERADEVYWVTVRNEQIRDGRIAHLCRTGDERRLFRVEVIAAISSEGWPRDLLYDGDDMVKWSDVWAELMAQQIGQHAFRVTRQVVEYAQRCFRRELEQTLDDPSWLLHPDEGPDALVNWVTDQYALAGDLGLNFVAELNSLGTEYERVRLRELIAGRTRGTKT